MNENEVERLTEDTLNSINGIRKTDPDDLLFQKIINSMHAQHHNNIKKNKSLKYILAFAVLILINIFSFFSYKNTGENKTGIDLNYRSETVNNFAREFFQENDDYSNYK